VTFSTTQGHCCWCRSIGHISLISRISLPVLIYHTAEGRRLSWLASGWLHTKTAYPRTVTHLSTNRARRNLVDASHTGVTVPTRHSYIPSENMSRKCRSVSQSNRLLFVSGFSPESNFYWRNNADDGWPDFVRGAVDWRRCFI